MLRRLMAGAGLIGVLVTTFPAKAQILLTPNGLLAIPAKNSSSPPPPPPPPPPPTGQMAFNAPANSALTILIR